MQKKTRTFLFWFVLIQPFLDFYWFYNPPLSTIFHFSIPTIIRIVGLLIITILFFSQKENLIRLKSQWWVLIYLTLLIIYSIAHLWYVRKFNSISPDNYGYSSINEILYLIRMALPILVIFITKYADFDKAIFTKIVQCLVGLFSGIIVITNLFNVSLTSYGDHWIKGNIFSWFINDKLSYFFTASKGFFNFANTISAILFLLTPLMLYVLVTNFNWKNITLFITLALSMVMIGTKTAALGFVLAAAVFLIAYLVHVFLLKNQKFSWKFIGVILLTTLCYCAILPKSPMYQRAALDTKIEKSRTSKSNPHSEVKLNKELKHNLKKIKGKKAKKAYLVKFIKHNYAYYSLNAKFVKKGYPYNRDPYFWHKIMKWPIFMRLSNRQVEQAMLDKIIAYNNNPLDKWFGISYVRMSNIFNLERDFKSQRYTLGILGTILFLGIYVISLIYTIVYWFIKKNCRSLLISSLILANGFALGAAYYSGNVMDFLTATIILGFFNGYMLMEVDRNKKTAN